jgi:hypothetical protein
MIDSYRCIEQTQLFEYLRAKMARFGCQSLNPVDGEFRDVQAVQRLFTYGHLLAYAGCGIGRVDRRSGIVTSTARIYVQPSDYYVSDTNHALHAIAMNTLHTHEQVLDIGFLSLPSSSIESSMGPPPTPRHSIEGFVAPPSLRSSQARSQAYSAITWDTSEPPSTPLSARQWQRAASSEATKKQPPLNEEEFLKLMRLASAHWQLRRGKGGVTKYFERVQKDFSKEIGRPFISTRRKITTTYEYYALLFNDKGSGTGIQPESELVGVMRIFVISGIKRRQMLARRRLTVC